MFIRPLRRLGLGGGFGGGAIASLLLGWTGAGPLCAQTSPTVEAAPTPAASQESAASQRIYWKKNLILLPIQVNEQFRSLIRDVQLYVKEQPNAPWKMHQAVKPDQKTFKFQAPRDGEYAFTMVTVDQQGRCIPKDVRNEPPSLVVVIDTHAPQVELSNLGPSPDGQLIGCIVRDDNLDLARVRIHYQGGDRQYRPMEAVPDRKNVYCVPAQAVFSGMVRVTAEDLAGNLTTREAHISQMTTTDEEVPTKTARNPEKTKHETVTPPKVAQTVTPSLQLDPSMQAMTPDVPPTRKSTGQDTLPTNKVRTVNFRPDGKDGPRFKDDGSGEKTQIVLSNSLPLTPIDTLPVLPPGPKVLPKRHLVNKSKIFLDYAIENAPAASVGKIEVWITRDRGKKWTKHSETAHGKNAVEIQLPEDGLYGVTLVADEERGQAGTPPAAGTAPDWLIEVDTSKPTAQILDIQTLQEKEGTVVQIAWSAHDNNLGQCPVDLFYAATTQGPWLPIAKGLKEEGKYRWTPPESIGAQAFLRMVAHDLAGNESISNTLEPIQLKNEAASPRAVIRDIRTEK